MSIHNWQSDITDSQSHSMILKKGENMEQMPLFGDSFSVKFKLKPKNNKNEEKNKQFWFKVSMLLEIYHGQKRMESNKHI